MASGLHTSNCHELYYLELATLGGAALDMVATYRGVKVSQGDREQILKGMLSLPPHPEVSTQLRRLKDAGFRLVTSLELRHHLP
jgi:2-haloacid dehalogenase